MKIYLHTVCILLYVLLALYKHTHIPLLTLIKPHYEEFELNFGLNSYSSIIIAAVASKVKNKRVGLKR